ncbi:mucosal addressin cell adhesion molecule 1 isoform X2 [Pyxicephalus adspersus]|uniref:mucosal addressin cell adhesion molecule 1 isoform X2 n=1 Tax=Pyxicephalus adspersus TaxID=30357 RepID=UPI003B5C6955
MAPSVISYILLHLFLRVSANYVLTITPQNPLVPFGGSIKLNCSINNPSCTTYWKGLDINLGSIYNAPGYSVLKIENADVRVEGTQICMINCPGRSKNLEKSVFLQVYALPETLLLSTNITDGIPYLHCFMKGARPLDSIKVQCYRSSEKLDNSEYFEEITPDEDLDIFNVTWSWRISNEDFIQAQTLYKCEAELFLSDQTFRIQGIMDKPNEVGTTEILSTTVNITDNQSNPLTTRHPENFSTSTNSATLYTRTPEEGTTTPQSTSTVLRSHTTYKKPFSPDTSLPKTLLLSTNITNGIPYLHCFLKQMRPYVDIKVQCYRGSEKLGASEDVTTDEHSNIFNVTWSWRISNKDFMQSQTLFKCEAELSLGEHTFRIMGILDKPNEARTTETLPTTVTITTNQPEALTTGLRKIVYTHTNSATSYTRTNKETPSSQSTSTVFRRYITYKELPTPETLRTTDPGNITEVNQTVVMTTATPATQRTSITECANLTTVPPHSENIIWMVIPAAGLVGSILLILHTWRQLHKKGFFQPNELPWSDCKHGPKDLVNSLETGSSSYQLKNQIKYS